MRRNCTNFYFRNLQKTNFLSLLLTAPLHTPLPVPISSSRTSHHLPTKATSCHYSPEPWLALPPSVTPTYLSSSPSMMPRATTKLAPPSLKVGATPMEPMTDIFPSLNQITTAMRTPSSLPMMNSPSFLPPTLLQYLYPCQQHQSLTPTGTASRTRGGQPA